MDLNVFEKNAKNNTVDAKNDSDDEEIVVSKKDILASIPESATKTRNLDLVQTSTEWRWRIIKLPDKEYIEISKLKDGVRLYANKYKQWVTADVDKAYDNFVVKIRYYYSD